MSLPRGSEDLAGIDIRQEDPEEIFTDLEPIGSGNYGAVFRGVVVATGEVVAIKQLLLSDKEEIENIKKEIVILSQSRHRNVVAYMGAYQSLSKLWIVMEYCEGGSADQIYKILRRPLSEPLIAYVCREVLVGLQYLHENKLLHRDIKGSNILLTRDGQVKLADFGVSTRLHHTMSKRNSFAGTLYWMAPEAIVEQEYDDRIDIWSLGITTIELAEGVPPHMGVMPARLILMVAKMAPPTLSHKDYWSPQMNVFVRRLLVKDKTVRPHASTMLEDPFVSPDAIGTREQLEEVVAEVVARKENMSSSRLRRGDFSSGSSTGTFVRRPSRESTEGSEGGSRRETAMAAAAKERAPKASAAAELLRQGGWSDIALPFLSTEDITFDELSYGNFHQQGDSTTEDFSLYGSANVDRAEQVMESLARRNEGARMPDYTLQTTRVLQQLYLFNKELPTEMGVSKEQLNRCQNMEMKYGTALKTIYRVQ